MDTIHLSTNCYIPIELLQATNFNVVKTKIELCFYKNIHGVLFQYYINCGLLRLQLSVTKFLYGSNSTTLKIADIDSLIDNLNIIIKSTFSECKISHVTEFSVTRLDLVSNFKLKTHQQLDYYMEMLKKSNLSRLTNIDKYTSTYAKNNSLTVNIYNKSEEDPNVTTPTLRVEFQFKNPYLCRYFKNNKTFGYILNNINLLNSLYEKELKRLNLDIKPLTLKDTFRKVKNLYTNGFISATLYYNLCNYLFYGKDSVSKSTHYRYKSILYKFSINYITLNNNAKPTINFKNFILFISQQTYTTPILDMNLGLIGMPIYIKNNSKNFDNHLTTYSCIITLTSYYDDS